MDEDSVRKILQNLEIKARETGRSLNSVRAQVAAKERERRIVELTLHEISGLNGSDAKLYQGVGKMFVQETPVEVTKQLKGEHKEAAESLAALQKKQKFLEGELDSTNRSLRSIFGRPA